MPLTVPSTNRPLLAIKSQTGCLSRRQATELLNLEDFVETFFFRYISSYLKRMHPQCNTMQTAENFKVHKNGDDLENDGTSTLNRGQDL